MRLKSLQQKNKELQFKRNPPPRVENQQFFMCPIIYARLSVEACKELRKDPNYSQCGNSCLLAVRLDKGEVRTESLENFDKLDPIPTMRESDRFRPKMNRRPSTFQRGSINGSSIH